MRKRLIALFSVLVLGGCAIRGENTPTYEIDAAATANAPWEVGENMGNVACESKEPCDRIFWGITTDGKEPVQIFFANGSKHTDPYLNIPWDGIRSADGGVRLSPMIDGLFVVWYENGQKDFEGFLKMMKWKVFGDIGIEMDKS